MKVVFVVFFFYICVMEEKDCCIGELWGIVAMGRDGEIGFRGDMPWHLPEDLRHFKALTLGHPVIMGRATWESLPKLPLPGRVNVVITRNVNYDAPGALVAGSLSEAIRLACDSGVPFVIGGGQIYLQSLACLSRVFVTRIDASFEEADTYFPALDGFKLASQSEWMESKSGLRYCFEEYERGS